MTTSEQARADNYMTPGYRTPSAWAASLAVARLHDADALQRDRQDRLDAMADAETLRIVADELANSDNAAYSVDTLCGEAWIGDIDSPRQYIHAAFAAVPGLRGEDTSSVDPRPCAASLYLDKVAAAETLYYCRNYHAQCSLTKAGTCCDEFASACGCEHCTPR